MFPLINIIIPSYGTFAALGIIAAFCLLIHRVKRLNLGFNKVIQMTLSAVLGIIVGSRFVFVLTMIPNIIADFSLEMILNTIINGGFVFYGGLLGALLGIYVYTRCAKLDLKAVMNSVAPCFPLFHAFGRIGCFMAGCCYGIPCSFGVPMTFDPQVTRFPVQLAEALCCLIILTVLLIVEKKRPDSHLLTIYLSLYAIIRFVLEFLRGDTVRGIWWIFSTSQWISVIILIIIVIKCIKAQKDKNHIKCENKL